MVVAFKTARKYFFSRRTPAKVSGNLNQGKSSISPVIRHGYFRLVNQGRDDRYIRLQSHSISHSVVSRLRQSHSITFSQLHFHVCFLSTCKSWQKTKTLILTTTNNSRGKVNITALLICLPNPDQPLGQCNQTYV